MNKRIQGSLYEKVASEYLEKQGYRVLERNFRSRMAEIDIVAREGRYLVFVEVKQRSGKKSGWGCEAVDYGKQKRICQAASFYLFSRHVPDHTPVRFDVISIDNGRIRLIRNAFFYRSF